MATYVQWLAAQSDRADQVGELARAWGSDTTHRNLSAPASIARWIEQHWGERATQALAWHKTALDEYLAGRSLRPVTPPAATASVPDAATGSGDPPGWLADIQRQLGWLRAAVTLMLPPEALAVLDEAENAPEPVDFGALHAAADFTRDEPEAADA